MLTLIQINSEWTITGVLIAGITALASVVTMLWRMQLSNFNDTKEKLCKCEEQHTQSTAQIRELAVQVAEVRGKQDGITELANQVLTTIKGAIEGRNVNVDS